MEDVVILTDILNDELNSPLPDSTGKVLESINGTPVTSLSQAYELLHPATPPENFIIELKGIERPLILPAAAIPHANKRISENYSIPRLSNLKAK